MTSERATLVAAAEASIRKGSKSFAVASRLFDRETRERVWLLYAWCRACDDIADEQDHGRAMRHGPIGTRQVPEDRLITLRTLTELAMAGEKTGTAAFDALAQLRREVPFDPALIDDVLAGFALDAAGWRPRDEAQMLRYCYHVAGSIGVLMALVMGVSSEDGETLARACELGMAFQLANIARDIWEDDALGRCYLPMEWLAEADIPPGEVTKPHYRSALVPLVQRLCALAGDYRASALRGTERLTLRQRWAVLAAAHIYGAIAEEVERLGAHAWDHRIRIPRADKLRYLWMSWREARQGRLPAEAPVPALSLEALQALARGAKHG